MASLHSHGEHGEFDEGVGYAGMTVWSLANAARAMALTGDRRAIEHPFLQRFPRWYIHHLQPGGMLVNAFDAGGASRGRQNVLLPILALLAICTRADEALWTVQHYFEEPPEGLVGLAVSTLDGVSEENAPALYAHYPRATRINWRSSWADDADGVWVRGGHTKDQHHHHDMGHVNYIAGGRPILIEAGTPNYSNPKMASHYASGAGHNVLQLGADEPETAEHNSLWQTPPGWQSRDSEAPIHVTELNPEGASVAVTVESGYDGLKLWERHVIWDNTRLIVKDNVHLLENRQNIVLFRWHLGTETDVDIKHHSDTQDELAWPDAIMVLEGSEPLEVGQKKMPDHTLESEDDRHLHTCIRILSADPTNSLKVKTKITLS
ncbi:MAG: heparinase II/III family protein [Candidatus Brocadiia bacterium]